MIIDLRWVVSAILQCKISAISILASARMAHKNRVLPKPGRVIFVVFCVKQQQLPVSLRILSAAYTIDYTLNIAGYCVSLQDFSTRTHVHTHPVCRHFMRVIPLACRFMSAIVFLKQTRTSRYASTHTGQFLIRLS